MVCECVCVSMNGIVVYVGIVYRGVTSVKRCDACHAVFKPSFLTIAMFNAMCRFIYSTDKWLSGKRGNKRDKYT